MKYLLNFRSFISLMILFSFFDNFGMEVGETEEAYDHLFKVVFVGDAGVGKTKIVNKFVKNYFSDEYDTTIGVEFYSKNINFLNNIIKLQLWDTAGKETFRSITRTYYKSSNLIVFVYAVDDKKSFENIQNWVKDVKNYTDKNTKFLLVGNKLDLGKERKVTKEDAEKYAKENKMEFIEVSAKEGTNINDDMFNSSLSKIFENMEAEKNNEIQVDILNKDININHNNNDLSCWSEYYSCCPCLEKTEGNVKDEKEVKDQNQNKDENNLKES